jgi:predicted nucleic acid-binding protein
MTISIDTNAIAALWNEDDCDNRRAAEVIGKAHARESLAVSPPVYAELMAGPLREEAALDRFFAETGIEVEWNLSEAIWREAGRAYRSYAHRRVRSGQSAPRRILADFVVGAHAKIQGYAMLSFEGERYAKAFPGSRIFSI